MFELHDWTLLSIEYEWKVSKCALLVRWSGEEKKLVATDVRELYVPHRNNWGPSVSINAVTGPVEQAGGLKLLKIEMQTGDEVTITAADFALVPV